MSWALEIPAQERRCWWMPDGVWGSSGKKSEGVCAEAPFVRTHGGSIPEVRMLGVTVLQPCPVSAPE